MAEKPDHDVKLTPQTWVSLGTVVAILVGSLGVMWKISEAESSTMTRLAVLEQEAKNLSEATEKVSEEVRKIGSFVQKNSETLSAQLERVQLTKERLDAMVDRIQRLEERQDQTIREARELEKKVLLLGGDKQ